MKKSLPKSILFYSEAWGKGGIETFVKNVSPALAANGISIDVFATWDWEGQDDAWLDAIAGERFVAFRGYKPSQAKRAVEGPRAFRRILERKRYGAVWINTMNGMGFQFAREAKRCGVPVRVVHSHNSDVGDGAKTVKRVVSNIGSTLWGGCATKRVACSHDAGRHLFGESEFEVLPNGIDIERFRYDSEKRKRARNELGIAADRTLIGNIGRICAAKNPLFQIEVFAEYRKLDPNATYLMLGRLDMADEVRELACKLNVGDGLIIHDPVEDTSPYYCALDGFLMPSLYEGLGFVQVEAQCASLPVLCTDTMPREADITDLSAHCSLLDGGSVWAERLYDLVKEHRSSRSAAYAEKVAHVGFSLDECAERCLQILSQSNSGI